MPLGGALAGVLEQQRRVGRHGLLQLPEQRDVAFQLFQRPVGLLLLQLQGRLGLRGGGGWYLRLLMVVMMMMSLLLLLWLLSHTRASSTSRAGTTTSEQGR